MSNELYEKRVSICRGLRTTEEELAAVDKLIDDWRNGTDEKAVLNVYIDGEDTRFNLSKTDTLKCLDVIRDSHIYSLRALEQELIDTAKYRY